MRTSFKSARRRDDDPQIPLLEPRANPKQLAYTIEQVRACPNEVAAIDLSCRVSGLMDKQIADSLSMNEGNWSKLRRGQRGFMPGDRIHFMCAVGNQILREWEEESLGYDSETIRRHEDNKDKRIHELEARLAQVEHDREVEREYERRMRERR